MTIDNKQLIQNLVNLTATSKKGLCYLCKREMQQADLRPYGENKQLICFDCAKSCSPRIRAIVDANMDEAQKGDVILTDIGFIKMTSDN